MNQMFKPPVSIVPARVSLTDDASEILRFSVQAHKEGGGALVTLTDIRGGAARALGAHMAVAADGRFCGYVSGGCVEAAVAAEAIVAIAEGRDTILKLGDGSPFFDIVLPCGGGITVAIHVVRDVTAIEEVLRQLDERRSSRLAYDQSCQRLEIERGTERVGWYGQRFVTAYRPRTRVVMSGQAAEVEAIARQATACGYDVVNYVATDKAFDLAHVLDRFSAAVLLHHDLDAEAPLLAASLRSSVFYVGALGSARTHHRRSEFLKELGFEQVDIDRIKAPIGLFGPTRDVASLGLSVMADIAAARSAGAEHD